MSRPSAGDETNFEDALRELEGILRNLEDGTSSLEESLGNYERGVGLLKLCEGRLRAAEQRIVQLTGTDDDEDGPTIAPFAVSLAPPGEPVNGRARPRPTRGDELPF